MQTRARTQDISKEFNIILLWKLRTFSAYFHINNLYDDVFSIYCASRCVLRYSSKNLTENFSKHTHTCVASRIILLDIHIRQIVRASSRRRETVSMRYIYKLLYGNGSKMNSSLNFIYTTSIWPKMCMYICVAGR